MNLVFMFFSCLDCTYCDTTSAHRNTSIGSDTGVVAALSFQEEICQRKRNQLYVKIYSYTENVLFLYFPVFQMPFQQCTVR